MTGQTVSIEPDQFATIAINALHAGFLGVSRAQAKRHFARVQGGGLLELGKITAGDGSEVQLSVGLDHTQFHGRFGFTMFRAALDHLLSRLAERIRTKQDLNMYTSADTGAVLFNIPSVFTAEGQTNVFMLGMDAPEQGALTLRLQFLDPAQFQQQA